MPAANLISELRRRIKDVRYSSRAMGIAVTDPGVSSAIAEVTQGHLIVTITGTTDVAPIDLNLSNPRFDTVGKLHQVVSRLNGYRSSIDEDADYDHLSLDFESFGPSEIVGTGVDLRHRIFSDTEIEYHLVEAIQRHNPTLNLQTLPPQEEAFVLQLAQSNVYRTLAADAVKRKNLDTDVKSLLELSSSFEESYRADTRRLSRAITSPKEANSNNIAEGDAVLGTFFRKNLRTGFNSPMGANLPPDAAVLVEPDIRDEEDTNVKVHWQRNKNYDFYSYELWMDTRPDVARTREGLTFSTPFSSNQRGSMASEFDRPTTSRLVFRSFGANSNFDTAAFATFVEEFGQLVRSFTVPDLEPDTDYYFRLYIIDLNYENVASNVVRYRTKAKRARFTKTGALSATSIASGGTLTLNFDPLWAPITTSHRIKIGDKPEITPTVVDAVTATVTVPSFMQLDFPKDVVVISPNNLVDIVKDGLMVTS